MVRSGYMLVVVLAVGCHTPPCAPPTPTHTAQLPLMPRGAIEPDLGALSANAATPPPKPEQYRRLTSDECRTLAVRNAPLAADLDAHPENEPSGHHVSKKDAAAARVSRLVRGYAADEIRNRSAGEALDLYYQLAAAEGRLDLVDAARSQLQVQLRDAEQAVKVGAADRADADRIRRQILELESQRARLEAGIASLNAGLAGRLGLDPADPTPIWPADVLRVTDDVPDVDEAVRAGLHYRPDLNLLRTLAANAEQGGELTNAVLASVTPLLAKTDPANPLAALVAVLKKKPTEAEAQLHRQVTGVLQSRERQASAEIRAAVATVRGERAATAAKAAEVQNLRAKVDELEKRKAAGQNVAVELAVARLDLLKLRGELVQSAADWHVAGVKLRQAMGLLVRE